METYARKVNNQAVDVTTSDPKTIFHPEIAAQFIIVPNGTQNGAQYDGAEWVNPAPPVVTPPAPPVVTPPQFKILILEWLGQLYTAAESDVGISAFIKIIDDPRLTEVDLALNSVQNGLKYSLKKIGLSDQQITDAMTSILTGVLT